jgi:hypothetical protein
MYILKKLRKNLIDLAAELANATNKNDLQSGAKSVKHSTSSR